LILLSPLPTTTLFPYTTLFRSECYVTFGEGLTSLLKAMHKGTEHVGKLPERAQRAVALNHRMRTLAENLQKAVADENYETAASRSEEHTSELQSRGHLVCRLLL